MSFQAYLTNIQAKTGKSASELQQLAIERGLATESGIAPSAKAGHIVAWLKSDFELGHGHAMAIVAYIKGMRG